MQGLFLVKFLQPSEVSKTETTCDWLETVESDITCQHKTTYFNSGFAIRKFSYVHEYTYTMP